MNIAVVDLSYFKVRSAQPARGERLLELCRRWPADGSRVTVVTTFSCVKQLQDELEGCQVSFLAAPGADWQVSRRFQAVLNYLHRMRLPFLVCLPQDTAVIYTLTGLLPDVWFAFIQRLRCSSLKWVAHVDNLVWPPWRRPGWGNPLNFIIYSMAKCAFFLCVQLIKKADLIFTVSDAVAKGLSACGIPADRIRISGNGISPVAFALKGGEKEYDAVFMGRIEVAKGIIDLIKAWALLCHGNPRLRLAIIGSAVKPMQKKLNKLITRFHIEGNVLFLGCIQGSEKFNLLAKSRIFISPSYDESFGQSVMEAVACGLPVVAYDLDIYRKLYPEGLLHTVSPADTKALAEEIAFVLSNQSFCDEAAGRGRDSVRVCEWGAIMSRELEEIGALEKPKV